MIVMTLKGQWVCPNHIHDLERSVGVSSALPRERGKEEGGISGCGKAQWACPNDINDLDIPQKQFMVGKQTFCSRCS